MSWEETARASGPDGEEFILYRSGDDFAIRVDGWELMSSRAHGSEDTLARLACQELAGSPLPQVLVGGLGLGYTLRAALDALPPHSFVSVAEIVPAVVAWNRGTVGSLNRWPLHDPRVQVIAADVADVLAGSQDRFDAVLLDVDNGPRHLSRAPNRALYTTDGLRSARGALRPGGVLAIWAPSADEALSGALAEAGFSAQVHPCAPSPGFVRIEHTVFIARRITETTT